MHGTHVLIAGSTGAGKASLSVVDRPRMLPAMAAGLVRVQAADPKLMELAYGRAIFDRYGRMPPTRRRSWSCSRMPWRRCRPAPPGRREAPRPHPSVEHPFVVVLVDEVAFLTAYQPDRGSAHRVKAALATLTTQGRAVGFCVIAALQDPRKEVMSIRNLFPDRIAMRLDEPEQVDMVLGDGARDRGATADLISTDPATGAGVAYVRLQADPDPVRVRAAWVDRCRYPRHGRRVCPCGGAAAGEGGRCPVMDGAHTHHHGPGGAGIGTALMIGAGLAVATQIMNAVAAIVHALLIGLTIVAGLALAGLTAYAVAAYRRRLAAWHHSPPAWLPPASEDMELSGDREVVSLRQAITELHAQLAAARAALNSADRPGAHQHLHFHALDPGRSPRSSPPTAGRQVMIGDRTLYPGRADGPAHRP